MFKRDTILCRENKTKNKASRRKDILFGKAERRNSNKVEQIGLDFSLNTFTCFSRNLVL